MDAWVGRVLRRETEPHRPGLEALVVRLQQVHDGGRGVLEPLEADVGVDLRRRRQLQAQPQHLARVEAALAGARQRQRLPAACTSVS